MDRRASNLMAGCVLNEKWLMVFGGHEPFTYVDTVQQYLRSEMLYMYVTAYVQRTDENEQR